MRRNTNIQCQAALQAAYKEWNERVREYDLELGGGLELGGSETHIDSATLEALKKGIEDSEEKLQELKDRAEESALAYQAARHAVAEFEDSDAGKATQPGQTVVLKYLPDLIQSTATKGSFVIDTSRRASVVLRYQCGNFVNACSQADLESEFLRKALLGAVLKGKFFVVDLMDVDALEYYISHVEAVQEGLHDSLLNHDFVKEKKYLSLVQEADGKEYQPINFVDTATEQFRYVMVTCSRNPPKMPMEHMHTIRVVMDEDDL